MYKNPYKYQPLFLLFLVRERCLYLYKPLNKNQIIESYAQDGKTSFEYDFKGNITKQSKQFTNNFLIQSYWNNPNFNFQSTVYNLETTFDALNRPTFVKNPDNSVIEYQYDKGGMLQKVLKDGTEHITNIKYNEKGQRKNIYYGNNTKTRYYYNDKNFRLERILTTRNLGADILQDLNYKFDAVGNIISVKDNAQKTHFFGNKKIDPVSTYEYDALYRLIKATGREKNALGMPTYEDFVNNLTYPNDKSTIQKYIQKYEYDVLGNILQMKGVGFWTRNYIYETGTNRLIKHDLQPSWEYYNYDEHGNMITMPHLELMLWDEKDRLFASYNYTTESFYNYDAQGNRTRKVVVKDNITETRYYIGNYEIFKKETSGVLDYERKTINISDDEKIFVRIEQKTEEGEVARYQILTTESNTIYNGNF